MDLAQMGGHLGDFSPTPDPHQLVAPHDATDGVRRRRRVPRITAVDLQPFDRQPITTTTHRRPARTGGTTWPEGTDGTTWTTGRTCSVPGGRTVGADPGMLRNRRLRRRTRIFVSRPAEAATGAASAMPALGEPLSLPVASTLSSAALSTCSSGVASAGVALSSSVRPSVLLRSPSAGRPLYASWVAGPSRSLTDGGCGCSSGARGRARGRGSTWRARRTRVLDGGGLRGGGGYARACCDRCSGGDDPAAGGSTAGGPPPGPPPSVLASCRSTVPSPTTGGWSVTSSTGPVASADGETAARSGWAGCCASSLLPCARASSYCASAFWPGSAVAVRLGAPPGGRPAS